MVLYQEFESRILVPRVYGRVLRLPPAVVLVALLVGGTLAGHPRRAARAADRGRPPDAVRELRVDLPGEASRRRDGAARTSGRPRSTNG